MNKKDPFGMKRVLKKHSIGALKDVPVEIIQRMIHEAALQGNPPEIAIKAFQKNRLANDSQGGFCWNTTEDGKDFWLEVLGNIHFSAFLKKYPLKVKVRSPRAKMTTARNLSKGQIINTINLLSHILTNEDIELVKSERDFIDHAITCLTATVYDSDHNGKNLWDWRTNFLSNAMKLAKQTKDVNIEVTLKKVCFYTHEMSIKDTIRTRSLEKVLGFSTKESISIIDKLSAYKYIPSPSFDLTQGIKISITLSKLSEDLIKFTDKEGVQLDVAKINKKLETEGLQISLD